MEFNQECYYVFLFFNKKYIKLILVVMPNSSTAIVPIVILWSIEIGCHASNGIYNNKNIWIYNIFVVNMNYKINKTYFFLRIIYKIDYFY